LGIQPKPVIAEAIAWLVAFVPLLAFVLWPTRRTPAGGRAASAGPDARAAVGGLA
jgi:hypothetical protein